MEKGTATGRIAGWAALSVLALALTAAPRAALALNAEAAQAHIDAALEHLESVTKALKEGKTGAALTHAEELKKLLAQLRKDLRPPAEPVANARCPIMGSKLDRGSVPANLTREFEGRKVGFCCAGCPVAWDKLPESKRDALVADME